MTDINSHVTFVAWLPESKLSREKNCSSIDVSTLLELREKLCSNRGIGVNFSVWRASIDKDEVPVRCVVDILLMYFITSPILLLVAVLSTTVENHHHISALDFAEDASHVLERVVGFGSVV